MQTQLTHSTLTQTHLPSPLEQAIPGASQAIWEGYRGAPGETLKRPDRILHFEAFAVIPWFIRVPGGAYPDSTRSEAGVPW